MPERITPEEVDAKLAEAGLPVRPCGSNGDWCVNAWHMGPGPKPNQTSGDTYLLDQEDGTFSVVQRFYDEDLPEPLGDNDEIRRVIDDATLAQAIEALKLVF